MEYAFTVFKLNTASCFLSACQQRVKSDPLFIITNSSSSGIGMHSDPTRE